MAESGQYGGFMDKLLAALKQRSGYNQDLIGQRNALETDYFNPPEFREPFRGVWDPNDRVRLAEGRRAQAGTTLNTFNDILKERQGSMTDMAAAVARGYQEEQDAAQQARENEMAEKNYALSARASARADKEDQLYSPFELAQSYLGVQGPVDINAPKLPLTPALDIMKTLYNVSRESQDDGLTFDQQLKVQDRDQATRKEIDIWRQGVPNLKEDPFVKGDEYKVVPMKESELAKRAVDIFGSAKNYGAGLSRVADDVLKMIKQGNNRKSIERHIKDKGYTIKQVDSYLSRK